MSDKMCDFCGTINDAHHSAACVDRKTASEWHDSHKKAIAEKWPQTDAKKIEQLERENNRLQAQVLKMRNCGNCKNSVEYSS
jgi:hypothetical protein